MKLISKKWKWRELLKKKLEGKLTSNGESLKDCMNSIWKEEFKDWNLIEQKLEINIKFNKFKNQQRFHLQLKWR